MAEPYPQLFNPWPTSSSGSFTKTHCVRMAFAAASTFLICWPAPAQHNLSAATAEASGNCSAERSSCPSGFKQIECCQGCLSVFRMARRRVMNHPPSFPKCPAVEFGEEVADEHLLRGGVSRQLSDVRVVALVRVFADLRTRG